MIQNLPRLCTGLWVVFSHPCCTDYVRGVELFTPILVVQIMYGALSCLLPSLLYRLCTGRWAVYSHPCCTDYVRGVELFTPILVVQIMYGALSCLLPSLLYRLCTGRWAVFSHLCCTAVSFLLKLDLFLPECWSASRWRMFLIQQSCDLWSSDHKRKSVCLQHLFNDIRLTSIPVSTKVAMFIYLLTIIW